jgi:predicted DNA binding CopG/RHH family protein
MKHVKLFEQFVNEARTIEKIEKDRNRVINDMAEVVLNWKAAKGSGDKEAEASFLQRLKDLTEEKKGLEKELNQAIAGKDRNIELVISESATVFEGVMSEIDLLAKEAKTFKDFVKEFKKEYSDLTDAGDIKELEQWLKTVYDNAKNESLSEGEEIKKAIHDHWKELYDEDFISEYPKVAKILKNRPHVDRRELARLWDEIYGEDFKEKYPDMWDRMEESEVNESNRIDVGTFVRYKKDKDFTGGKVKSIKNGNAEIHNWDGSTTELPIKDLEYVKSWNESDEVSERNAFLGARAKAIEEDLEEFEFNGKMYPVLNKSK